MQKKCLTYWRIWINWQWISAALTTNHEFLQSENYLVNIREHYSALNFMVSWLVLSLSKYQEKKKGK